MKALILLLLLSACAGAPIEPTPPGNWEFEADLSPSELSAIVVTEFGIQAVDNETVFLPLVSSDSTKLAQPCRYVENTITISYPYDGNRSEGPFTVVDCLQHSMNWLVAVNEDEIVVVVGTDPLHWGTARQGDPWLQVLIWQGSERPYTLNLTREE